MNNIGVDVKLENPGEKKKPTKFSLDDDDVKQEPLTQPTNKQIFSMLQATDIHLQAVSVQLSQLMKVFGRLTQLDEINDALSIRQKPAENVQDYYARHSIQWSETLFPLSRTVRAFAFLQGLKKEIGIHLYGMHVESAEQVCDMATLVTSQS